MYDRVPFIVNDMTDLVLDFLSDMESTESYYGLNSWLEGASTTQEHDAQLK